jgi:formamidopyrimidine-DNA glycosylase
MPELPEVEILCRRLSERLSGKHFERLELASISALKTFSPSLSELQHRAISEVRRRGKFVCVEVDSDYLVVNLARSGWIKWRDKPQTTPRPGRGPLALRARLEEGGGFDVTEMATEKRLAIWAAHDLEEIEAVSSLGPEPLDEEFTLEHFASLLSEEKGDLKHAISRQSVIAGVGNAYSDEALHAACLSPFKAAAKADPGEMERLYKALREVLRAAIERAADLEMEDLKDGKRSHMAVHGRTGEPCPRCGDTIAEVSYATRSLQYCPTCQTAGKKLADRRLSRLLK